MLLHSGLSDQEITIVAIVDDEQRKNKENSQQKMGKKATD